MQVQENKPDTQRIPTGRKCTVCDHPDLKAIEELLADVSISQRGIAKQFGLSHISLYRHAKTHLVSKVKAALQRKQDKQADVFLERHEHLYAETLQYVEDAKSAVKMQRVTVEEQAPDGSVVLQDRYQAFRDVGAMAPALQTAVALQRVLGDATGRFASAISPSAINLNLQIVMPRAVSLELEQPAIDVTAVPAIDAPTED